MRFLLVAFALLTLMSSAALANTNTTMVLHALATSFGPCPYPGPDVCTSGGANVSVAVGPGIAAYLFLRNYTDVAGCQAAFEWPAAWPVTFGLWDCQVGQVNGTVPAAPGGPTAGTIAAAFNCITGGLTAPIGRIHFATLAAPGCMNIIESSFPFGTHIVDCTNAVVPIPAVNRGSICAGSTGYDACEPVVPVEPTTWGNIKSQYQQ